MTTPDPPDTPSEGELVEGLTILSGSVRPGQQVTIYAFPAGRFGDFDYVDGQPRHLGAKRHGLIVAVRPVACPIGHDIEVDMDGVRVTFDDGSEWDSPNHAVAAWYDGPRPTLADLKAAEALIEDTREYNDAVNAAYMAEGMLSEFDVHPSLDPEGEHVVVVHTPFDEPDDDPVVVTPEQAEQFALRLLQAAALARVERQTHVHPHTHPHEGGFDS